jgi:hypothetical protein
MFASTAACCGIDARLTLSPESDRTSNMQGVQRAAGAYTAL